ncbi:hypothetical protein K438DRAFT_1772616 [Mycena galopus ATCC 62051]|nr:hypothetical protein K438DRAFT_1772616 [Mycena galopus ATCC 62051]
MGVHSLVLWLGASQCDSARIEKTVEKERSKRRVAEARGSHPGVPDEIKRRGHQRKAASGAHAEAGGIPGFGLRGGTRKQEVETRRGVKEGRKEGRRINAPEKKRQVGPDALKGRESARVI